MSGFVNIGVITRHVNDSLCHFFSSLRIQFFEGQNQLYEVSTILWSKFNILWSLIPTHPKLASLERTLLGFCFGAALGRVWQVFLKHGSIIDLTLIKSQGHRLTLWVFCKWTFASFPNSIDNRILRILWYGMQYPARSLHWCVIWRSWQLYFFQEGWHTPTHPNLYHSTDLVFLTHGFT